MIASTVDRSLGRKEPSSALRSQAIRGRMACAELRGIELDENVQRLDLDSYEQSKERLAAIRQQEPSAKISRQTAAK